ncbi:hypothetical protein OG830_24450 [Streptomyces sp. NBC_00121]|uniref:hypothetical protein n=1 Tax=unclassified Streptomyces TaxID=2593676 RepID=UPI0028C4A84F|nr:MULTISPECIES: hypothetical protein [unclassified Streptomyces]WNO66807.1 hypothetical protein RPQ02_24840 [Streptomyces sp. AM2-3-1]WSC71345.1 hypothetical protein OG807_24355 [Streptomyces sp. NBC_01760]
MSIRRTARTRRVVAVVSMTAALALAVTACGSDDGGKTKDPVSSSSSSTPSKPSDGDKGAKEDTSAGDNVDPNVKLAEVRGSGLTLVINQVKRDSGGFVTVQGEIKNVGDRTQNSGAWAGTEPSVAGNNSNSVAGATLVDKAGKKRYYVLRDTESRCLCTTGIPPLSAGESTPIFMQFPAPPSTTTEVDFTLPTFATTSLKISG